MCPGRNSTDSTEGALPLHPDDITCRWLAVGGPGYWFGATSSGAAGQLYINEMLRIAGCCTVLQYSCIRLHRMPRPRMSTAGNAVLHVLRKRADLQVFRVAAQRVVALMQHVVIGRHHIKSGYNSGSISYDAMGQQNAPTNLDPAIALVVFGSSPDPTTAIVSPASPQHAVRPPYPMSLFRRFVVRANNVARSVKHLCTKSAPRHLACSYHVPHTYLHNSLDVFHRKGQ